MTKVPDDPKGPKRRSKYDDPGRWGTAFGEDPEAPLPLTTAPKGRFRWVGSAAELRDELLELIDEVSNGQNGLEEGATIEQIEEWAERYGVTNIRRTMASLVADGVIVPIGWALTAKGSKAVRG